MLSNERVFLMVTAVLVFFGCIVIAISGAEIMKAMLFVCTMLVSIFSIVSRIGYTSLEEFIP